MKQLDLLDLKMIEGIGAHSPRNITGLARTLKVPAETLRKRLIRLRSRVYLHTNIYHANLGMKKALVHAEAIPGKEQLLFDSFKTNDFWIYINRCYGLNERCLGIYTIPVERIKEFEDFVSSIEKLGLAKETKLIWSTCFQAVHARINWFNPDSRTWTFEWDKWVKEIPRASTDLPKTLVDPDEFPILADEKDMFILKELEKDPTVNIVDLADKMGISQQLAEYHYKRHVLERGLIESFEVEDFRFDMKSSDMFYFFLTFDSSEKLAKFASSLLDKPFALGLGKVLNENKLIAHLYLPKNEFRNFVDILSKLISIRLLQSYSYLIQDLRQAQRQTISFEYFKKRSWTYDHKKHLQKLEALSETRPKRR
jgi:DNA-binding Lrp family transcriptional regulator